MLWERSNNENKKSPEFDKGVKTLATVENCFIQTLSIYLLLLLCIILFGNTGSANLRTRGVDFYNLVYFL